MPTMQTKSKTKEEFLKKFQKETPTDECYTPPDVYEVVKRWTLEHAERDITGLEIVRPFYPGGDYEHEDYTNKLVIDNPPFSILGSILKFYFDKNIPFFLFCNALTAFTRQAQRGCVILCDSNIIYENGAFIRTAFITNLIPSCDVILSKTLTEQLDAAQKHGQRHFKSGDYKDHEYSPAKLLKYIKYLDNDVTMQRDSDTIDHDIYGGGWYFKEHDCEQIEEVYKNAKLSDN